MNARNLLVHAVGLKKKGFSLKIVPLLKPASGFLFFLTCVCMVRARLRQTVIQL